MAQGNDRDITDDLSDVQTKELMQALPSYFNFPGDISHSAYLNWRLDSKTAIEIRFCDMAKGYFETSIDLIEKCIDDNLDNKADIWIFPIMFNIVHGIELYLKGINSKYRVCMDLENGGELKESIIEGNHDIDQLCRVTVKYIRKSRELGLLDEILFVQKFVDLLYSNTDDMTFARYPITVKKENQFYTATHSNVTIDLYVLRQWVLRVHSILNNISDFLLRLT